jgi:hypothetical protein
MPAILIEILRDFPQAIKANAKVAWVVTTHLYLATWLRIYGAITPLSYTSSKHDA